MRNIRERIEEQIRHALSREPELQAYRHIDTDAVRAQIDALPRTGERGPLFGRAVAVKDVFDTFDMPTGYGFAPYADHRPNRDAAAVAALRSAGALIFGKTETTEFAFTRPAPTVNPHNALHTPGGSSSGSAATVGAGSVDMALGTQTAGSIVRPAAYCGAVGYKPTFGTVSRSGVAQLCESLDTVGGFGRTVDDAAALVGALARRLDLLETARAAPPRIGVYLTPDRAQASTAVHDCLDDAVASAARRGASVVGIADDRIEWHRLQDAHVGLMSFEAANALRHEYDRFPDCLGSGLVQLLEQGARVSGVDAMRAKTAAAAGRRALRGLFEDIDVLLTFSAPDTAPAGLGWTGDPMFNRPWSLLGGPALHLPVRTASDGLPVGVQLVAPPNRDAELLAAARWLETMLREGAVR